MICVNSKDLSYWYEIAKPILDHPEYQKRKKYMHHGDTSVYTHSVGVSLRAFQIGKKFNLDLKSLIIAGLLHDFYKTPWQDVEEHLPLFKRHGFTHAKDALLNSRIYFSEYLNPTIENSILRHMFPLNKIPPKTKEGFVLTIADKLESLDLILSKKSLLLSLGVRI